MNHFVFVVCGSKEHTDTLNFSLKYLRHFSKSNIIVITDKSRNEKRIEHNNIIDIKTPIEFNNHQASIFLKTSLHQYLPMKSDDEYCYLDSDIVAINKDVDTIFDLIPTPILFAKDHCPFNEFSPSAMNCNCLIENIAKNKKIYSILNSYFPKPIIPNDFINNKDKSNLDSEFSNLKKKGIKNRIKALSYLIKRYILPIKHFRFSDYQFNKKDKTWKNKSGEIIDFDYKYYCKILKREKGISIDKTNGNWADSKGNSLSPKTLHCDHLSEHIKNKFKIDIPSNWRHWNGGVFRFNKESTAFLNRWHKLTIEEFSDNKTKTRDQGTLAVTAWEFQLQDTKTLPIKFNFITEYNKPEVQWDCIKGYTYNNFKTTIEPSFLHIYHNWGEKGWSIWDSLTNKIN